jgi:transcriptional regulator GlxA family with amidase domain
VGINLALFLVEKVCSLNCAVLIVGHLALFLCRSINDPAESPWLTHHNYLHTVQDKLQANLAKHWTILELAKIAHCSPRHLARLLKSNTQISCQGFFQNLRMSLAKQLLTESSLSMEQVAVKVGFNDVPQFRRLCWQFSDVMPATLKTKLWGNEL